MLTETAKVVSRAAGAAVLVEAQRRSQCQRCSARQGCGHQLLNAMHWQRRNTIEAYSQDAALLRKLEPGDQVTIAIDEHLLLRQSLSLYLLPLFAMLLSVGGVMLLGAGEGLSILAALLGLGGGFLYLHKRLGRPRALAGAEARLLGRVDTGDVEDIDTIEIKDRER